MATKKQFKYTPGIHIERTTDKKYYVLLIGKNSRVLSVSENFNSLASARNNIVAQQGCFPVAPGSITYTYQGKLYAL